MTYVSLMALFVFLRKYDCFCIYTIWNKENNSTLFLLLSSSPLHADKADSPLGPTTSQIGLKDFIMESVVCTEDMMTCKCLLWCVHQLHGYYYRQRQGNYNAWLEHHWRSLWAWSVHFLWEWILFEIPPSSRNGDF